MLSERSEDIERGLGFIAAGGEVMPGQAEERVGRIYESVRETLRVPLVNFLFRVLATHPTYLSFAWGQLEPYLLTRDFERAADALREKALLEPAPGPPQLHLPGPEDLADVRRFTETIHYALPKLLLVASALDEGLGGEPGDRRANTPAGAIAAGVAEGTLALPMVAPEETSGELSRLFEEIQERHGHPGVASYYRALGRWPGLLADLWGYVSPLVGSDAYLERKRRLLEDARGYVLRLPLPTTEEAAEVGVRGEEVEELRAVLAVFRYRVIPDTFVEVSLIKALLDGPESARRSRFSFVAAP